MTQVALADAVGITQSYVSEIERGTRGASPELLAKIAESLDCPVDTLERVRPLHCPDCGYGYDPQPNGSVPLHTLPETNDWCPAGGQPEQVEAA